MISVVAAVIIRDGRILLTQRRADKSFPFFWESPGGKVEGLSESHHEALSRELRQELGIEVASFSEEAMWCGEFSHGMTERVFVSLYRASISGEPRPLEGQGIGWFRQADLASLPLTPANQRALGRVLALMGAAR